MSTNLVNRLRRATGDGDAALLMQRILFWTTKTKKGGLHKDNARWSYRTIEQWAEETGMSFHQAQRALGRLVRLNLIEKKAVQVERRTTLIVRPTTRGESLTDLAESQEGSSQICEGGPSESAMGVLADSPFPYMTPVDQPVDHLETSGSCDPSPGIAEPGVKIEEVPEGDMVKGLDSVANLNNTKPAPLKDWEAEKTHEGFAQCFVRLKHEKQGGYIPSVKASKIPGQVVGALKPVFHLTPPGKRLAFLRWAVDNWATWVSVVKAKGMTGAATFKAMAEPPPGKSMAAPPKSKNFDYSHLFLSAHRAQAVQLFLDHETYKVMFAPKPKSAMVEPDAQVTASAPKPKPKDDGGMFDAVFAGKE